MKILLIIKAWKLFILLCILPIGLLVLSLNSNLSGKDGIVYFLVGSFVAATIYIGWYWSLGIELNKKVLEALRPSPRIFKASLIVAYVYLLLFIVVWLDLVRDFNSINYRVLIPLHVLFLLCVSYAALFISRNYALVHARRTVSSAEIFFPLIQIWIYPIGILLLQPKINKLFE